MSNNSCVMISRTGPSASKEMVGGSGMPDVLRRAYHAAPRRRNLKLVMAATDNLEGKQVLLELIGQSNATDFFNRSRHDQLVL